MTQEGINKGGQLEKCQTLKEQIITQTKYSRRRTFDDVLISRYSTSWNGQEK